MGTRRSNPAARMLLASPIRLKISMVRALHRSIFGRNSGAGFCSIRVHRTHLKPSAIARVSPTGPAPTTRTSVSMRERSFHGTAVVRTSCALAPVFPRPLERKRTAGLQHGGNFAASQGGDLAKRPRLHLQL